MNYQIWQKIWADTSENTGQLRIEESVAWNSVEKREKEDLKILRQLRQYLPGKALKVVEFLEQMSGSKWHQIALHLEELENFKPLRPGNVRDLERLADLLDGTVVTRKEAGRHEELGSRSLYLSLCKKLTEAILVHY